MRWAAQALKNPKFLEKFSAKPFFGKRGGKRLVNFCKPLGCQILCSKGQVVVSNGVLINLTK